MYELDPSEKLTLIYLLCEASRSNKNGETFVSREHYRLHSRLENRVLDRTISKLQELQIIEQPRVRGMYTSCVPSVQQNRIEENRGEEKKEEDSSELLEKAHEPAPAFLPQFSEIKEILQNRNVEIKVQKAWLLAYPDAPWIMQQIKKALAWEAANPQRKKKHFGRFMGNWFSRDWDKRQSAKFIKDEGNKNLARMYRPLPKLPHEGFDPEEASEEVRLKINQSLEIKGG